MGLQQQYLQYQQHGEPGHLDRAHDHLRNDEAGQDGNDDTFAREVLANITREGDLRNSPVLDPLCHHLSDT